MNDEQKKERAHSSDHRSSFIIHRLLPTDRWVRLLLAPVFVFVLCGIDRNYQTDLWHHLARGRAIADEGRLLDEDRFTYTVAGTSFQDVNWLSQLAFYRIIGPFRRNFSKIRSSAGICGGIIGFLL